jgi:hypothetical protein
LPVAYLHSKLPFPSGSSLLCDLYTVIKQRFIAGSKLYSIVNGTETRFSLSQTKHENKPFLTVCETRKSDKYTFSHACEQKNRIHVYPEPALFLLSIKVLNGHCHEIFRLRFFFIKQLLLVLMHVQKPFRIF